MRKRHNQPKLARHNDIASIYGKQAEPPNPSARKQDQLKSARQDQLELLNLRLKHPQIYRTSLHKSKPKVSAKKGEQHIQDKKPKLDPNFSDDLIQLSGRQSMRYRRRAGKSNSSNFLELGKKYLRDNQLDRAEQCFRSVKDNHEQNDSVYYLALLSVCKKDYSKAGQLLDCLKHPELNQNHCYLKSLVLGKLCSLKEQRQLLECGLALFPTSAKLLLLKAKSAFSDRDLQRSSQLVARLREQNPSFHQAQLLWARILYKQKNYGKVRTVLQGLKSQQEFRPKCLLLEAKVDLRQGKNQSAFKTYLALEKEFGPSTKTLYLFGVICSHKGQLTEAVNSFEEAARTLSSRKYALKSIAKLIKIKIRQKDFYSAYHFLSRAEEVKQCSPKMEYYRLFVESVISMMRKKASEAVPGFDTLLRNKEKSGEFLVKAVPPYASYCYAVTKQFQKAISLFADLSEAGDTAFGYNYWLVRALFDLNSHRLESALQCARQAKGMLPSKTEPYIICALVHMEQASLGAAQRQQLFQKARAQLEEGSCVGESTSSLLFLRAVLQFSSGDFELGCEDLSEAISKCEENNPKHFYVKGLANGSRLKFKQAKSDFTVCINLDEDYAQAYLERAKCNFDEGDLEKATEDLVKYEQLTNCPAKTATLAKLYFNSQLYLEALSLLNELNCPDDGQLLRLKCLIRLGMFQQAYELGSCLGLEQADQFYIGVLGRVVGLHQQDRTLGSQSLKSKLFGEQVYEQFYSGVVLLLDKNYPKAQQCFYQVTKVKGPDRRLAEDQDERENEQPEWGQVAAWNMFLCAVLQKQLKRAYEMCLTTLRGLKTHANTQMFEQVSKLIFLSLKESANFKEGLSIEAYPFEDEMTEHVPWMQIKLAAGILVQC